MYLCVINKKMEENFDIREQQLTTKERDFENALRPLNFEDFSGQDKVVDNLRIFVKAARLRAEALDHVLLHGPPGLGKTTLSNIIANELGVGFKVTSGPVLDKPGDLAGVLTSLEPNDVLFIVYRRCRKQGRPCEKQVRRIRRNAERLDGRRCQGIHQSNLHGTACILFKSQRRENLNDGQETETDTSPNRKNTFRCMCRTGNFFRT